MSMPARSSKGGSSRVRQSTISPIAAAPSPGRRHQPSNWKPRPRSHSAWPANICFSQNGTATSAVPSTRCSLWPPRCSRSPATTTTAIPDQKGGARSIVLLVNDSLALEAAGLQDRANVVNHGFEAANENVDIASPAGGFEQVLLHVPRAAGPAGLRTAERGPEAEIRMLSRQLLELLAIEQGGLIPHPENQGELVGAIPLQPVFHHGPEWRHAGPYP